MKEEKKISITLLLSCVKFAFNVFINPYPCVRMVKVFLLFFLFFFLFVDDNHYFRLVFPEGKFLRFI